MKLCRWSCSCASSLLICSSRSLTTLEMAQNSAQQQQQTIFNFFGEGNGFLSFCRRSLNKGASQLGPAAGRIQLAEIFCVVWSKMRKQGRDYGYPWHFIVLNRRTKTMTVAVVVVVIVMGTEVVVVPILGKAPAVAKVIVRGKGKVLA